MNKTHFAGAPAHVAHSQVPPVGRTEQRRGAATAPATLPQRHPPIPRHQERNQDLWRE